MTTVSDRRLRRTRAVTAVAVVATAALMLTACGSGGTAGSSDDGGKLKIVTSTSAWGSVAKAVGGDAVEVEPIISNAEADPHSYESTPRDAAKISSADLVVYNGGGYDSFVEQILSGTAKGTPSVRATESGHDHEGHEGEAHGHGHHHSGNEHVWYDLPTVHAVAGKIAGKLGELRPAQAGEFRRAAAAFDARVGDLQARVSKIEAEHGGERVLATAPVADLLVEQAGLVDITPPSFVQSAESGNDPAAAAIARIQNLVDSRRAAVLIHNPQTASALTDRVNARARSNGTPVVEMSETLPKGKTYVEWMGGQISALRAALDEPA